VIASCATLAALVLALLWLAAFTGCAVAPPAPTIARIHRPTAPELPEPVLASVKVAGKIIGEWVIDPLQGDDDAALKKLRGRECYVIEAEAHNESIIRLLSYIRELNAAPFWEDDDDGPATDPDRAARDR